MDIERYSRCLVDCVKQVQSSTGQDAVELVCHVRKGSNLLYRRCGIYIFTAACPGWLGLLDVVICLTVS
jgi:hypothetical protein